MLRPPSKVYQGLAQPILIAGVEPNLILLNVGVLFFFVIVLRASWWVVAWAGVAWVIHQALKAVNRADPFARRVYLVYQLQADRYEPYPEPFPRRGRRPVKFGRGVAG